MKNHSISSFVNFVVNIGLDHRYHQQDIEVPTGGDQNRRDITTLDVTILIYSVCFGPFTYAVPPVPYIFI